MNKTKLQSRIYLLIIMITMISIWQVFANKGIIKFYILVRQKKL